MRTPVHLQVFGGDSLLNLSAGPETLASQNQWVEDMEVEVALSPKFEECSFFAMPEEAAACMMSTSCDNI